MNAQDLCQIIYRNPSFKIIYWFSKYLY